MPKNIPILWSVAIAQYQRHITPYIKSLKEINKTWERHNSAYAFCYSLFQFKTCSDSIFSDFLVAKDMLINSIPSRQLPPQSVKYKH